MVLTVVNLLLGLACLVLCIAAVRKKGDAPAWEGALRYEWAWVGGVLLFGLLVRVLWLTACPAGLNQDEASMGYDAYALLHYGVDRNGYHNPVYFTSWGSGQNALYAYLVMPFLALFGPTVFALRLPAALIGTASLLVFYLLLKRAQGCRMALVGMVFLAICPWHIMLSRWSLESNILPAFLLLSVYLLTLTDRRPWMFVASMAAFGLALYTYAPSYIVVPVVVGACTLCLLWCRRVKWRHVLVGGAVLFVLALPLMLLILINHDILPEIRTPLFSIPRFSYYRGSGLGLSWENVLSLLRVLVLQTDGSNINTLPGFGVLYVFSLPFVVLGIGIAVRQMVTDLRKRQMPLAFVMLVWFAAALMMSLLTSVNITRANAVFLPMVYFAVCGIWYTVQHIKAAALPLAVVYLCAFGAFVPTYYAQLGATAGGSFYDGFDRALAFAEEKNEGTVHVRVTGHMPYIMILWYEQLPPDVFYETVIYSNPNGMYRNPEWFGHYCFDTDARLYVGDVLIIDSARESAYREKGWQVEAFGRYAVAYVG